MPGIYGPGFKEGFLPGLQTGTALALKKMDMENDKSKAMVDIAFKVKDLQMKEQKFGQEQEDAKRTILGKRLDTLMKSSELAQKTGDQQALSVLDAAIKKTQGELGLPTSVGLPTGQAGQFWTNTPEEALKRKLKETRGTEEIKSEFREPKALKTYITPDNKIIHLPNNQMPPAGAVPYQSGVSFEAENPDGTNFRLSTGNLPGKTGTTGMEKGTKKDIEGKLFNAQENIARLNEIASSYKPEFLQVGTKLAATWTGWKEKLKDTPLSKWVDMGVSEQDRKELEEFSGFKRDAINNINLYIKEITGAQMSEKEADRIRKGMPDPGEGILDGDAPTQFESKWKSSVHSLRMAQARYITLLKRGFGDAQIKQMIGSGSAMSLANMEGEINQRGAEIAKELKAASPQADDSMIQKRVQGQLQKEFFSS